MENQKLDKYKITCPRCGYRISARILDINDLNIRVRVEYNPDCKFCKNLAFNIEKDITMMLGKLKQENKIEKWKVREHRRK